MGICYLVGAGEFYGTLSPTEHDLVIAADGGYDNLMQHGIRCDLLIGDLDSISEPPTDIQILRHPAKKDYTDMYLAYTEGKLRGFTDFIIYGGVGGREDHTFANYSLLAKMAEDGVHGKLIGRSSEVSAIKDTSVELFGERGKHFSAFAYGREARGVTVKGLEYECTDITLTPSFPLAVSNLFKDAIGKITVRDGILLLMKEL